MFKLSNVWWTLGIKEMRFESHNSIRKNKNVLCYFLCAELGWDRILFFEDPVCCTVFKRWVTKEES